MANFKLEIKKNREFLNKIGTIRQMMVHDDSGSHGQGHKHGQTHHRLDDLELFNKKSCN